MTANSRVTFFEIEMKSLAAAVLTLFCCSLCDAQLQISNEALTTTSIIFDISGTIDGPIPEEGPDWLFFVDSNRPNGWITNFNNAQITSNISVNGVADEVDNFWIESEFGSASRDRLTLNLDRGWSIGDTLSGTFTANWATAVDLTDYSGELQIFWGRDGLSDETAGTLQGTFSTIAVPEPSSALFISAIVSTSLLRRRR